MRTEFKEALGEDFIAKGGKELIVQARVEEPAVEFYTAADLMSLISKASGDTGLPEPLRVAFKEASSVGPIGDNGKPRMLKLTAWIGHADVINANRDLIPAADMKEAADNGMFSAPYFGMVDYNHDFNLYGVWYNVRYDMDTVAGHPGLLAEGVIFAWRYSDLADRMLAMQARQGYIDVSMSWIPGYVEFAEDQDGTYAINHKPVFFTTSVLDIDPAFPDSRGLGTESTDQLSEERQLALTLSSVRPDLRENSEIETLEVDMKIDELIEAFRAEVAKENQETFAPLIEAASKLPAVEEELANTKTSLTTTTTRVAELETSLNEVSTASEELSIALQAARDEVARLNEELVTLREFKESADAREAEAAKVARRDKIMGLLSEPARVAFEAKDAEVKEKLLSRWENLEQDELDLVLTSLNSLRAPDGAYETASRREGILPTPGGRSTQGKLAMDEFLN